MKRSTSTCVLIRVLFETIIIMIINVYIMHGMMASIYIRCSGHGWGKKSEQEYQNGSPRSGNPPLWPIRLLLTDHYNSTDLSVKAVISDIIRSDRICDRTYKGMLNGEQWKS